ncbi:hypothetical protein HOY80DRAFT_1077327 [Tuber brumale]|nr:hypothetical protein HOY80DRAFT_1077327 [Tuber brumale]
MKFILDHDACSIRKEFCETHRHWRPEVEWANWGFTDEMAMTIGDTYGPSYVWQSKDEKWNDDCIGTTKKGGGTSVMCWGMIGWNYKGPFFIWEEESQQEKKEATEEIDLINLIIVQEQEQATAEWKASEDYTILKEQELLEASKIRKEARVYFPIPLSLQPFIVLIISTYRTKEKSHLRQCSLGGVRLGELRN